MNNFRAYKEILKSLILPFGIVIFIAFFFVFSAKHILAYDQSIIDLWSFDAGGATYNNSLIGGKHFYTNGSYNSNQMYTGGKSVKQNYNFDTNTAIATSSINNGVSFCYWWKGNPAGQSRTRTILSGSHGTYFDLTFNSDTTFINTYPSGSSACTSLVNPTKVLYNSNQYGSSAYHHICYILTPTTLSAIIDGTLPYECELNATLNLTSDTVYHLESLEENFDGNLDEIQIYNYPLSQIEVIKIMDYGKPIDVNFHFNNDVIVYETDPSLLTTLPDFKFPFNSTCFTNEVCNISFTYNTLAIGGTMYLTPYEAGKEWPEYAIASTAIDYVNGLLELPIAIPPQATATTTKYCFYLDHSTGDIKKCYTSVYWIASSTFQDLFDYETEYDHACDNVATSTGIFDEFRYGVECGLIKASVWLLYPRNETLPKFMNNTEKVKRVFPFNTFFDLTTIVKNELASSTNASTTIGMPFIRKTGTTTDYYILPVISSSSMPNLIGQDNNTLFRNSLGYFAWILTAIYSIIFIKIVL